MKDQNKQKLWQDVKFVFAILLGIGVNVGFVFAQSSSPSYQAVDFVNSSASLSASSSYQLNDSVDYYGGVHDSASYHECTGDFAVLSACTKTVTPPPPPPPPPPVVTPPSTGGSGGGGCAGTGCTSTPPVTPPVVNPVVNEPKVIPPVISKPKFVLPYIKEPSSGQPSVVGPAGQPGSKKPQLTVANKPVVTKANKVVIKIPSTVVQVVNNGVRGAAPNVICEDLTCTQADLLRGSAPELAGVTKPVAACNIYVYGGFLVNSPCDVSVFIWVLLLLSSLFVLPVSVLKLVKAKVKKLENRIK